MTEGATTMKVRREEQHGGAIWHVVLDDPKGNVLDSTMTAQLTAVFEQAADSPALKVIVISGEGRHFSFGASVEEHLPESVAGMLAGFHRLFRVMAASGVPVVAAVSGQCLGGGLELAAFCQRVIASPDARLGQPEIMLGVLAPVASAILADRVGRGAADDLILTGRSVDGTEAASIGLVDELEDDPLAAAMRWAEQLLPRSSSSLRFATRAARLEFMRRFDVLIADLEQLYLEELMATHDAGEGIRAFLEKRDPVWSNS